MKPDKSGTCPHCASADIQHVKFYATVHNGPRELLRCQTCGETFAETSGTPMEHLKTPLGKVAGVLKVRSEGMGLRATGRVFGVHKDTVTDWEERFAEQKRPLMLYALCYEFIRLTFEGDEVYTVVGKRGEPCDSEGWTAIIMERGSRFITEQRCGTRDAEMFNAVMGGVAAYIEQSGEVTFLSDGERRYGNTLFDLCAEQFHNGQPGRPPKVLPKGVKVRLKNKGSQAAQNGRPKYEAPHREHPETVQDLSDDQIHANHVEAQNAALRRRNSAFRRRTNTYAKCRKGLQRTLDVHQLIHNFVRRHWTTGQVPAVAMGILADALSLEDLLCLRFA
jgi:transposase-like protein